MCQNDIFYGRADVNVLMHQLNTMRKVDTTFVL